MAFGSVARAGEPFAQRLWDDPAFALYQEAAEAMDRRDYARAAALARSAVAHYPDFVLAHYLLGQVALAEAQWDEAAAAFRQVLEQYPGSLAAMKPCAGRSSGWSGRRKPAGDPDDPGPPA